ncbi:cytochrome P450 2J6-like [Hypomesus transpacificus]|uniref:cytochrome P450 2J6-like n=1 Tax=Hypomesus transpacificus TaxID=137520 RepID=UPI001F07C0DE|nr:cytochrome P450 2J6-like [Hypomesus transpacificus]
MLVTIFILCAGSLLLAMFLLTPRRPQNFPPGPQPVPVFGNVLQLSMANPMKDLDKLSRRYGDVYSLYLGWRPTVMLHGLQAVREALVTRAVDFAGRPQGMMINHVTENKGLIMGDYGAVWKEHRRFALTTMRNFGLGKKSMEERILEEAAHVSACLEETLGEAVDPLSLVHSAASNIICSVLFGQRYDYRDKVLSFIINSFKENAQIANGPWAAIYDTFPLLRRLPLPFQKVFKNYRELKRHTVGIVDQHRLTRTPGQPRDVIDCYLDEMEKRDPESCVLDEERLVMLLLDLHFAGTDTSSNTILTALLYLATHTDIQAQCQREIDSVLGDRASVLFEDRHSMPFVMAAIHDAQRLANIAPLGVFHATTRPTKLQGYDIPEGTLVITNLTSVLFESSQWERPNDFHPAHFLGEDGRFTKPDAFLAFSAGPRVCLGELLARMELFLILVTLLRHFLFLWPEDAGIPDLNPVFGGIQSPQPFRVAVRLRASSHPSPSE